MPFYGITITSNKLENFNTDKERIAEAVLFLETKGAYLQDQHFEVQPQGRHLLHLHGLFTGEQFPFFPFAKQRQLGVNSKIEQIYDLKGWLKYIIKSSDEDPIWKYQ